MTGVNPLVSLDCSWASEAGLVLLGMDIRALLFKLRWPLAGKLKRVLALERDISTNFA